VPGLLPHVDPDGLLEYSVVYTDRAVNHMSVAFQTVMTDISSTLASVYNASAVAIVPGSGTFGMEAVARQFATGEHAVVVRNGWFSYRWTQIFDAGAIPASHSVCLAQAVDEGPTPAYAPAAIEDVVATVLDERPGVVFAPHVETASGMILPDEYIARVGAACREVDALFVLDCIASGAIWVDMQAADVDVLISAPQKGWSGPPCGALVMLGARAEERLATTTSTSFAADLKKWREIMAAYEGGDHAYHATMPTEALRQFRDVMRETVDFGLGEVKAAQQDLGDRVRSVLADRGFANVAASGFGAPGVVVSYTDDPAIKNGSKFKARGLQIAGGVPLQIGEPEDFSTFRVGLFGLDKLADIDQTVSTLAAALDSLG
jgi:aspartate aminotransferase-like enzyme